MPQEPQYDFSMLPDQPQQEQQGYDFSMLPDQQQPDDRSLLHRGMDWWNDLAINKPIPYIGDVPKEIGDYLAEKLYRYGESGPGFLNKAAMLGGAYTQGLGEATSGFLTPLNLATMGAFEGAGALQELGTTLPATERAATLAYDIAPRGAPILQNIGRGLSAPLVLSGGAKMFDPESTLPERVMGGVEAAGGVLGLRSRLPEIGERIAAPPETRTGAPDTEGAVSGLGTVPPSQWAYRGYRAAGEESRPGGVEPPRTSPPPPAGPPGPPTEPYSGYRGPGEEGRPAVNPAYDSSVEAPPPTTEGVGPDITYDIDENNRFTVTAEQMRTPDIIRGIARGDLEVVKPLDGGGAILEVKVEEKPPEGTMGEYDPSVGQKVPRKFPQDPSAWRLSRIMEELSKPEVIHDEQAYETLMNEARKLINSASHPDMIRHNFDQIEDFYGTMNARASSLDVADELSESLMEVGKNPNDPEAIARRDRVFGLLPLQDAWEAAQQLRDEALDKARTHGVEVWDASGQQISGPPPNKPVGTAGTVNPSRVQSAVDALKPYNIYKFFKKYYDKYGREVWELARTLPTTGDLSASMRQGSALFGTMNWFRSFGRMLKATTSLIPGGGEQYYQTRMAEIKNDPLFRRKWNPRTRTREASFAEKAKLQMTDLRDPLNTREESQRSKIAEKLPLGIGRYVRASNRAYNMFLNDLRYQTFKSMVADAEGMSELARTTGRIEAGPKYGYLKAQRYTPEQAIQLNPKQNMEVARAIASFVNVATGRGDLGALEKYSKGLSDILFAPRLFASHINRLNPLNYITTPPPIRKAYLKSAIHTTLAWGTFTALADVAASGLSSSDVSVSHDPNSSDFGKLRVGNVRFDAGAGFLQFIVAFSRLLSGEKTSSSSGIEQELGQQYHAETRKDVIENFMVNKLHPMARLGYDLLAATHYRPVYPADRVVQMYAPLVLQDFQDILAEDPTLLPLMAGVITGIGSQTYGGPLTDEEKTKGETPYQFIPKSYDYRWEGGRLPWIGDTFGDNR